jgi:hypothetical protein
MCVIPIRDFQKMRTVEGNSMTGKHFLERASSTLVDQCVVRGGKFLLNVLLARAPPGADRSPTFWKERK